MPDFATGDLALAIVHHLLIFALAGIIAFEVGVIKPGLSTKDIARLGRADMWYGILAALIIIVGFSRAIWFAKGWAYYSVNHFFWAKIGAFLIVGLLSIQPTLSILRWRRAQKTNPSFLPDDSAIKTVRHFLWLEVFFFAWIPIFAAAMARGYGMPN